MQMAGAIKAEYMMNYLTACRIAPRLTDSVDADPAASQGWSLVDYPLPGRVQYSLKIMSVYYEPLKVYFTPILKHESKTRPTLP